MRATTELTKIRWSVPDSQVFPVEILGRKIRSLPEKENQEIWRKQSSLSSTTTRVQERGSVRNRRTGKRSSEMLLGRHER